MELLRGSWCSRNSLAFHPSISSAGPSHFQSVAWGSILVIGQVAKRRRGQILRRGQALSLKKPASPGASVQPSNKWVRWVQSSNKEKWATSAGLMNSRESGNFKFLIAFTRWSHLKFHYPSSSLLELWSQWKRSSWLIIYLLKLCYYDEDLGLVLQSICPSALGNAGFIKYYQGCPLAFPCYFKLFIDHLAYYYLSSINQWCSPHSSKFIVFIVTILFTSLKCRSISSVFVIARLPQTSLPQAFLL